MGTLDKQITPVQVSKVIEMRITGKVHEKKIEYIIDRALSKGWNLISINTVSNKLFVFFTKIK